MSYTNLNDKAYGLQNPLQTLAPRPISALRNPATTDQAAINTLWCNTVTQENWVCAGTINNSTTWNNIAGGSGDFTALTVTTGPSIISGTTSINNNVNSNTNINSGTSTGSVTIGGVDAGIITIQSADNVADAVNIVASNVAGGITLTAGTGGIESVSAGIFLAQDLAPSPVASPTATVAAAVNLGTVTFTGFTTAAYSAGTITTQVFTITNANITTASGVLVTVNDLGTNDAQMAITRVKLAAGSMAITVGNFGSAALNGNLEISFWIYRY